MLLLSTAVHPQAGAILALSSSLAGNFLFVVDQAERLGIRIRWTVHARTAIPVTALTRSIAAA